MDYIVFIYTHPCTFISRSFIPMKVFHRHFILSTYLFWTKELQSKGGKLTHRSSRCESCQKELLEPSICWLKNHLFSLSIYPLCKCLLQDRYLQSSCSSVHRPTRYELQGLCGHTDDGMINNAIVWYEGLDIMKIGKQHPRGHPHIRQLNTKCLFCSPFIDIHSVEREDYKRINQ